MNESVGREVTSQARSTTVYRKQQRINNVCLLAKRGETLRQLLPMLLYVYISKDVSGFKISCAAHGVGESVD